eukprot:7682012-Alexandrium_andersonii.AAC.1
MHHAVLAEATFEREHPVVKAKLREERKALAEAPDTLEALSSSTCGACRRWEVVWCTCQLTLGQLR